MDSDRRSAQVERLEVVETGRRRRWSEDEKLKIVLESSTKAINYCLSRWDAFARFLDDGRMCLSNNAAERELRTVAVGKRN